MLVAQFNDTDQFIAEVKRARELDEISGPIRLTIVAKPVDPIAPLVRMEVRCGYPTPTGWTQLSVVTGEVMAGMGEQEAQRMARIVCDDLRAELQLNKFEVSNGFYREG
jgi:hypothetical protein